MTFPFFLVSTIILPTFTGLIHCVGYNYQFSRLPCSDSIPREHPGNADIELSQYTLDTMVNCSKHTPSEKVAFLVCYYGILFLITITNIVGNGLVLSLCIRHRKLRCPANYFIFSLAVSDLVLGCGYPVYIISHMDRLNSWGLCWPLLVMVTGTTMASSYNLVLLTLNRYLAVVKPLLLPRLFTGCRSLIFALVVWAVSLTMATTVYVEWQPGAYKGVCRYEVLAKAYSTVSLTLVTAFLPIVAMITMYAHLTCITHRQVRRISDEPTLQGPEYNILRARMAKKNIALAKMAAILVGYFAISWMPLLIFLLISSFCPQCGKNIPEVVRAMCRLLLHSNTAVNVFIYAGRHPDFREVFLRDFRQCCCCSAQCCQKSTEPEVQQHATQEYTAELKTMSQLEAARTA